MPVRRTKRVCNGSTHQRRRTKRSIVVLKKRSKRCGCRKSRSRRSMKGGAGSVGDLDLGNVQRLIENAVAKGQSGGKYGSSSGSSYGSSLNPNSKNMKKRRSRSRRRSLRGGMFKRFLVKSKEPKKDEYDFYLTPERKLKKLNKKETDEIMEQNSEWLPGHVTDGITCNNIFYDKPYEQINDIPIDVECKSGDKTNSNSN